MFRLLFSSSVYLVACLWSSLGRHGSSSKLCCARCCHLLAHLPLGVHRTPRNLSYVFIFFLNDGLYGVLDCSLYYKTDLSKSGPACWCSSDFCSPYTSQTTFSTAPCPPSTRSASLACISTLPRHVPPVLLELTLTRGDLSWSDILFFIISLAQMTTWEFCLIFKWIDGIQRLGMAFKTGSPSGINVKIKSG